MSEILKNLNEEQQKEIERIEKEIEIFTSERDAFLSQGDTVSAASKELDIELCATNDVHYINKEDAELQDVVMCISMKTTIDDPTRLKMETDEAYLKTPLHLALDQFLQLFLVFP